MSHHNYVAQVRYPDTIVVNVSGVSEIASLTQAADDGALYRTEGCLTYYMDTSGEVHPVMA